MNVFTIANISFKYFLKNVNRYLVPIFIISLSILIFNIFYSSAFSITDSLNGEVIENKSLKLIEVTKSDISNKMGNVDIEEIKKLQNVTDIYPGISLSFGTELSQDEAIHGFYITVSKYQYPDFTKYPSCQDCVIVSKQFADKLRSKDIKVEDNSINIFYNSLDSDCKPTQLSRDVKIIGVLNSTDINFQYDFVIAGNETQMRKLYNQANIELCQNSATEIKYDSVYVYSESTSNIIQLSKELTNLGYKTDYALRETKDLPNITKAIIVLGLVLYLIVGISGILNIVSIINENLKNRLREFAIWKSLGTRNSELYLLLYFEIILIVFAGFVLSEFLFEIGIYLLNNYILNQVSMGEGKIILNNSFLQIFISFALVAFPVLIFNIAKIMKISNENINNLLKYVT